MNAHEIQERILTMADGSSDPEILLKAATIVKYAAESDRQGAETVNLQRAARTETIRFFVPIIAPLVSAMAVVGAFIFQTVQFREATAIQRQTVAIQKQTVDVQARAAEDAQWREAVKTLTADPKSSSGFAGLALVSDFLQQGSHRTDARRLILSLLGQSFSQEMFAPMFDSVLEATPVSQRVATATTLLRQLKAIYFQAVSEQKRISGPRPDSQLPTITVDEGRTIPNPFWMAPQVNREVAHVCTFLARLLRQPRTPRASLDLTECALWDCDLSGGDLSGAVLDGANVDNVTLVDADLRGVEKFRDSLWTQTAWWRAKAISPQLLAYLKQNARFRASSAYAGGAAQEEYDRRVVILGSEQGNDRQLRPGGGKTDPVERK